MRRTHLLAMVGAIAVVVAADTVRADLVLVQKPLTRRFPLNYCPFETRDVNPAQGAFGLFFTPPTPQVTLHIEVPNQNSFGSWGEHRIDNIVVVASAVYTGNNGPSPGFKDCYTDTLPGFPDTGPNAPAFFFNRFAPANLAFVELFDTTPVGDPARPWDLSQGAFFLAEADTTDCQSLSPKPSSAPRNPETGSDCTNGALALGQASDGNIVIKTSIPIAGLTVGTEYIVTGWWDTNDFSLENALKVTVIAPGTPGGDRVLIALDDVDQSEDVDQLVRIPDPGTGVGILVGSLGNGFRNAEAMAVLPGVQGPDRIFVADDNRLLELDPATGNGTLIGPIGFSDVDGLAFHPTTGVLYGVTYGGNQLIRIDTTTGAGTLVADDVIVGRRLEDLAFHPDGRAFVLTGSSPRVYQIDIATGAQLNHWVLSGGSSLESLVWSPDGTTLYSAADRGDHKDLVTIDLATSTIAFVSSQHSGFPDIEGLAWVSAPVAALLRWDEPSDAPPVPSALRLAAVPNPFNPSTRIQFELPTAGEARLDVLDVAGRSVATLVSEWMEPGTHSKVWDGHDAHGVAVASGIYVARLRSAAAQATQRLVLVR